MECKILLIDSLADQILVKESTCHLSVPVRLEYTDSIAEAIGMLEAVFPDVIMVGSDLVIKGDGFASLLKHNSVPIIVLCESWGLSHILKDFTCNVFYLPRPFDIEQLPEMIKGAYNLWQSFKKG